MDVMRALKFPLDDEKWPVKTLVGTLLSFIPFFGTGYQVTVARRVSQDHDVLLPGTDDLGEVLTDGIMATIAGLIYALPVLPLACLVGIFSGIVGESDIGGLVSGLATLCLMVVALPYSLLASALYWMGIIRYVETGNFSSFVEFRALLQDIRSNLNVLLPLLGYTILLGLLGALISPLLLVTCVGIFVVGFYYQVATGHLIGQAAQEIAAAHE